MKIILYPEHDATYIPSKSRSIIGDILKTVVTPILSGVSAVLSTFVKALASSLMDVLKTVFPGVYKMFSFAGAAFKKIYNTVIQTVVSVILTLTDTARGAIKRMLTLVNNVLSGIFRVLNALLQQVTNILATVKSMTSYMTDGLTYIITLFDTNVNGLLSTGQTSNTITRVVNTLKTSARDGLDAVVNLFNPMVSTFREFALHMHNLANQYVDRTLAAFATAAEPILHAMEMILNALNDMGMSVEHYIVRVVDNVVICFVRSTSLATDTVSIGTELFVAELTNYVDTSIEKVENISNILTRDLTKHLAIGTGLGASIAFILM